MSLQSINQSQFFKVAKNYWKLFAKLLYYSIDVHIVAVLAFWYSRQEIVVRWHNALSQSNVHLTQIDSISFFISIHIFLLVLSAPLDIFV